VLVRVETRVHLTPAPVADRGGLGWQPHCARTCVRSNTHNSQLLVTISEGATRRAAPPHGTDRPGLLVSRMGSARLLLHLLVLLTSIILYLELVLDVGLGFPLPATYDC
jgi:hypothetical protein